MKKRFENLGEMFSLEDVVTDSEIVEYIKNVHELLRDSDTLSEVLESINGWKLPEREKQYLFALALVMSSEILSHNEVEFLREFLAIDDVAVNYHPTSRVASPIEL